MRLQAKGLPNAGHSFIGDTDFGGHLAGAPMSGIGWPALKGEANHLGDLLVANLAGRAAAGKIGQALQTVLEKTAPPSPNSVLAKAHTLTNGSVRETLRTEQNDPRPTSLGVARSTPPHQLVEGFFFHFMENQLRYRSSS